jgi:hypothetical protein
MRRLAFDLVSHRAALAPALHRHLRLHAESMD